MLGNSITLIDFKTKYSGYINYINFVSEIIPIRNRYTLLYNKNLQQRGQGCTRGKNIKLVNELLAKFTKYNIKIDTLESKEDDILINLFTINEQIICFALVLDFKRKVGTITNLYYDANCLPDLHPKQVTDHMIAIIKEIATQSRMTRLELSDSSKFYCLDNSKFQLELKYANTLTSGEPYYYKFGFKFDDETTKMENHANVKYNKKLLSKLKTSDLKLDKFLKLCNKEMYKLELDKSTIESVNEFINKTWTEYSENPIIDFFNEIKYGICVVFASIHTQLFKMIGLKPFTNNLMYLDIISS
jgi:hypothetical protein